MKPTGKDDTSNFYNTKSYIISRDRHGIIHRNIKEDAHIEADELQETEELSLSLSKGKKTLTLINASKHYTMTPEATLLLKTVHTASRKATAIVSSNLSQKIMADFLAKNPGVNPLKIFPAENEAIKWLLTFKRKH